MKKYSLFILVFVSLINATVFAQQKKKCVTDEKMQAVFNADPQLKMRYQQTQRMLDEKVKAHLLQATLRTARTNAIINIPVVIHIMTSNPTQVTDAIAQRQLDTLNKYYGAQSATDSLRVYTPFQTTYGRSQIRFCLAQRTPSGGASTGINRRTTNQTYSLGSSAHPSSIVTAWNTQQYLNIWVVNFTDGTLGYSYFPGTFPPGDQRYGFVVDYRAFGSGAAYLDASYNQGKTAVHEIGHYFNLQHPWGGGSGSSSCTGTDNCTDTPPTEAPTFGCPNAPVLNTCSPTAPGVMWQNHMDYGDDACMLLFTVEQCLRMEVAVNTSPDRNTLLTSPGCQPYVPSPNDAGIDAITQPTSGGINCTGTVSPVVTLHNYGTLPLTSAVISTTVNGLAPINFIWVGNLAFGATVNVTLPLINLTTGNNTIVVSTSLPNGVPDGDAGNNSASTFASYQPPVALAVTEDFESGVFPPGRWSVINYDSDFTWQSTSPGKASNGALFINNYDDSASNNIDDFRSAPVNTGGVPAMLINFDLAHKNYPLTGYEDTLSVLVSGNCGVTWQTVYKKWGAALATAGSANDSYLSPASTDWRMESINVSGAILASGQVVVAFRNTSRYGNNIFIDNINLLVPSPRDIKVNSILAPSSLVCGNNITPQLTVKNESGDIISSFKVGYRLDGGAAAIQTFNQTIGANETITVNFGVVNVPAGNHTITMFTADPVSVSGSGDVNASNDSVTKSFSIPGTVTAPLSENFTVPTFSPDKWAIINDDGGITWRRNINGRGNPGSAFLNTFNYPSIGQKDLLVLPEISFPASDSLIMTFDVAASLGPLGDEDTLQVLVTKDCGNSFTTVYKKWGDELVTTSAPQNSEYFPQSSAQWRQERIDLSAYANKSPILLALQVTNNNSNNIFIDNVNVTNVILPPALKQQGFLVVPTSFSSGFTVLHLVQPTVLRYVHVFNTAGQLVWSRQYNSDADKLIQVDLSSKAAGMYFVKLGYEQDKMNRTVKVMKR